MATVSLPNGFVKEVPQPIRNRTTPSPCVDFPIFPLFKRHMFDSKPLVYLRIFFEVGDISDIYICDI